MMEHFVFDLVQDFGLNPEQWGADSELLEAIRNRNYPGIRARLRQLSLPLSAEAGTRLCQAAIQSGCTVRTVRSLLDACPEAAEFCTATDFFGDRYYELLEKEAAKHDRSDVLRMLMEEDTSGLPLAPGVMANAVSHGSVACTHLLTQQPGLDWAAAEELRYVWGRLGMDPGVDLCLRRVASCLRDEPFAEEGQIPLPDFLTVEMAVFHENWELLRRLCRERELERGESQDAVRALIRYKDKLKIEELVDVLDCLLTACPGLLRSHYPRYALAVVMTAGDEAVRRQLRPHLQSMPGKAIPMFPDGPMEPCIPWNGTSGMLTQWDQVLGREYYPVLQRNRGLAGSFFVLAETQREWDEDLERLLARSKVTGTPKPGRVSKLAREILAHSSPALIGRILMQGSALAGEDVTAMMEWCASCKHWSSRAAILAYGTKEVRYEL